MTDYPQLLHTAIDTTDARALAEFYRQLLGLQYRQGDDPPAAGVPDDHGLQRHCVAAASGAG